MPLSSHVTSLALSLALREAGYKQEGSMFIWTRAWTRKGGELKKDGKYYLAYNQYHGEGNLAAPLASEILEDEIMNGYVIGTTWFKDEERHAVCSWYETYSNGEAKQNEYEHVAPYAPPCYRKTLPDAAANMWLHIHSQKII